MQRLPQAAALSFDRTRSVQLKRRGDGRFHGLLPWIERGEEQAHGGSAGHVAQEATGQDTGIATDLLGAAIDNTDGSQLAVGGSQVRSGNCRSQLGLISSVAESFRQSFKSDFETKLMES
mmetsp:Transcript_99323/g.196797  ORF Transcript_99323/g.196797 Transcript_99323/m.196797 type:complete len:120 (-) Transcript_99323:165-524(-)